MERSLPLAAASVSVGEPRSAQVAGTEPLLSAVINVAGEVWPEEQMSDAGRAAAAFVFAVYDEDKALQFVGFSRDLRNSLRTVLGRQPEKVHFYRAEALAELDQERMLETRQAWFDVNGGLPPGNTADQSALWQEPVDAGSISERGRKRAAQTKVQEIMRLLRVRGLLEEMEADPELMTQGKVDFLPAPQLDEATLAAVEAARAEREGRTLAGTTTVDSAPVEYKVFYNHTFRSNDGSVFDCSLIADNTVSQHRVICSDMYPAALGLTAEEVVLETFGFLLSKKIPRKRTADGNASNSLFPMGYFAIGSVEQTFPDYAAIFEAEMPGEELFWRWTRTKDHKTMDAPKDADFAVEGEGLDRLGSFVAKTGPLPGSVPLPGLGVAGPV